MPDRATVKQAIRTAENQLRQQVDAPRLEAEILLAHTLGKPRTWLIAWSDNPLDSEQLQRYAALVEQRLRGAPVAHLTAQREFWSLPLTITPDTLIPRPETELLVEIAVGLYPAGEGITVADLGCGSGAIALAIASERQHWSILATDRSHEALEIARHNANTLHIENIRFHQGDWFDALPEEIRVDILVSNPPYIPEDDPHLKQGDLRFEPRPALASGSDGLDAIRQIVAKAKDYLKPGGCLLLEHGYN
ncbi:MAG: peptide chain release factor N(5)-glutamine methyltransferase, partial [Pseudomonadota bacterium]